VGLAEVLRATEYVVPAIEIVDARLQDPRKIFDTVADNGAAAGIAVGGRPVGPLDVDLRWVGGIMYKNSEIEETGVAAGVLGHPALGVAWLANKLGSHGVALEPGHLVLAGSFTRVVFAHKGDTLHADFGPLGIRVNAIAPGEIDTAILSPGTEDIVANQIPLHRLGTPDEVAKIIYVLCTDMSSYVNGAEIHINGGQHV